MPISLTLILPLCEVRTFSPPFQPTVQARGSLTVYLLICHNMPYSTPATQASKACDLCQSIFMNFRVPQDESWRWHERWPSPSEVAWRKNAQELEESIRNGCPVCFSFKRRFETGYLAMDQYDESGGISLLINPGRGRGAEKDRRCEILIWPEKGGRCKQDWLSYHIAAASGMYALQFKVIP
jgi:hypothetical protein